MEVLFLTLENFGSYEDHDMYADVMQELIKAGHNVHTVLPAYDRGKTVLRTEGNSTLLHVATDSTTGSRNLIKKGMSTLLIGSVFKHAIKKFYPDKKFDLVIYSTPPITFVDPIRYIKKKDGARTYLMLKDIFPQNAVDLGMLSKRGIRSVPWIYFRWKEKQLYGLSDYIGCMSQANREYLLEHNPQLKRENVGICANSLRILKRTKAVKQEVRRAYGIPEDKIVLLYGGNLGKPQGVDHIIACLKEAEKESKAYFIIAGDGTERERLCKAFENSENVCVMGKLPVEEYHRMVDACDVGLIFLDNRFTIPNFPSRLLSYTQAAIPVLSVTDAVTDIGDVIAENGFGWSCGADSVADFCQKVKQIVSLEDLTVYGERGLRYHEEHWTPANACEAILKAVKSKCE